MGIRYHRKNNTKITVKLFLVFILLVIFSASFMIAPALAIRPGADPNAPDPGAASQPSTGLGNAFKTDPGMPLEAVAVQGGGFNTDVTFETIVSTVLTRALGLMGAIFLVLAIYAGYNWMMAGGNEERVEKSKQTLTNAIIGLIIVLAAYAMVRIIVAVVGGVVFK